MKEKEFRKLVREELSNVLSEAKQSGVLTDLIAKFYMLIIKKDMQSSLTYLQNNPELKKAAENIKTQSDIVANTLLHDKKFLEFLKNNVEIKEK